MCGVRNGFRGFYGGAGAGLWDDGGPEGPGMGPFGRNSPQMGPVGFDPSGPPGSRGPHGPLPDLDVSFPVESPPRFFDPYPYPYQAMLRTPQRDNVCRRTLYDRTPVTPVSPDTPSVPEASVRRMGQNLRPFVETFGQETVFHREVRVLPQHLLMNRNVCVVFPERFPERITAETSQSVGFVVFSLSPYTCQRQK